MPFKIIQYEDEFFIYQDDIKEFLNMFKIHISYSNFMSYKFIFNFWSLSFIVEIYLLTISFIYVHKRHSIMNVK